MACRVCRAGLVAVALLLTGIPGAQAQDTQGPQDKPAKVDRSRDHGEGVLNNALGLTPKATDWAPEIGIAFTFR